MARSVQARLVGILLVAFTGCASYPVSKSLREQARPLTVAQVAANPGAYTGTVVIWGGRVINAVNTTNGGSIYVLALPLTRYERPVWNGAATGRFIARSKGFLDPEIFRNGQLITVAGEITGVTTRPLRGIEFAYPVVAIKELHLWYLAGAYPYYYAPYYSPGWYWGWYGPGWGWNWYGPAWGWGWYGPAWGWD